MPSFHANRDVKGCYHIVVDDLQHLFRSGSEYSESWKCRTDIVKYLTSGLYGNKELSITGRHECSNGHSQQFIFIEFVRILGISRKIVFYTHNEKYLKNLRRM